MECHRFIDIINIIRIQLEELKEFKISIEDLKECYS